ncbi:MAG: beta strand repeat-containing protein, partial [Vulcanibacillus sp.]
YVRIEINTELSLVVPQFNSWIILRFSWNNSEFNFMDIKSVSEIDILPTDLILCKCIFNGTELIGFDYSKKSWSYNYYNNTSNYNPPFKVVANYPYDQQVTVLPGGPFIFNGKIINISNETLSPEFTFPLPSGQRIDVVCLDRNSNIVIVTGEENLGLPLIKTEYFPIATVTFPASTIVSEVRGDYISYIHPNKFLSSEVFTSETSEPNSYVKRTDDGDIQTRIFISDVETGLSPFIVSSTTKVDNLNSDLFDDLTSTDFVRATESVDQTITGIKTFTSEVQVNNSILSTDQLFFNLINDNATNVNFAGVATTLTIGGTSGTVSVRNNTINFLNSTIFTVGTDDNSPRTVFLLGAGSLIVGSTINKKDSTFHGNVGVNGTLTINGDIIQNGSAYETHAEKLYTTKDLILTRDGATLALGPGEISGIEVIKYDGTNNLIFGTDSSGFFRVGEIGSLQILATRNDSMTDTSIPVWNATTSQFDSSSLTISDTVITGNITGYSGSVKSPSTTGVIRFVGMTTDTIRDKTILDNDDTLLELSGSYTPTGTWTLLKLNEDVGLSTTSTKLNYLTNISGTTGTDSTNIVFSTNPEITGLRSVQGAYYVQIDPATLTENRTLTLADGNTILVSGTMVPDSRTLTISTQDGVSGGGTTPLTLSEDRSWTLGLTGLALALHNLSNVDGIIAKTGASAVAARIITGTTNRISIVNGGGADGNPTIDIDANYIGQNTITTVGTLSSGIVPWSLLSDVPTTNLGYGITDGIITSGDGMASWTATNSDLTIELGTPSDIAIDSTNSVSETSHTHNITGAYLNASAAEGSTFRIPHGAEPTSPVDGDIWTTATGLYAQINGIVTGPFDSGGGSGITAAGDNIFTGTNTFNNTVTFGSETILSSIPQTSIGSIWIT